jgi:hypothetical protein
LQLLIIIIPNNKLKNAKKTVILFIIFY